ncbi:hypothetical protein, partial [Klebsiella pneumoniae]|uniref:hypothetical protein n=1 Tax=Klebsiella pneumoniae TaxID=573 RepID=UPI0013D3BF1D
SFHRLLERGGLAQQGGADVDEPGKARHGGHGESRCDAGDEGNRIHWLALNAGSKKIEEG